MEYLDMEISVEQMKLFEGLGMAVNGTAGGLAMGNSHLNDGIFFFVRFGDKYLLKGNMEGFEFIMNFVAAQYWAKNMDIFHKFEEYNYEEFEEYIPDKNIQLIDTRSLHFPKYIYFEYGNFHIINKGSTKDFLVTLDKVNKSVYYEFVQNKIAKIKHNFYDEIPIYKNGIYFGYFPARVQ